MNTGKLDARMNQLYCIYDGKKYIAQKKEGTIRLISKTKADGFEEYVDVLGNKRADLFECRLPLEQVEECFSEEIMIKYHDIWFPVLSVECNEKMTRFVLFSDDELIAKQNAFDKEEQFVFMKTIDREEIDELKIKKVMVSNKANEERIFSKEEISTWLQERCQSPFVHYAD